MTFTGFVLRSAMRSKRRTFLTAMSVAVSVFLLITLLTVLRELTTPVETDASQRRLITRHKASLTNDIPMRYLDIVRTMEGVEVATPFSWFGGTYIQPSNFFPRFGTDPNVFFQLYSEISMPEEEQARWIATRNGALVGRSTAEKYGMKIGDRVTIVGDIYPVTLQLEVCGIFDRTDNVAPNELFFHHKYLEELLGGWDRTGTLWIVATDVKSAETLAQRVDAMFANTDTETKTQTEKQFQLGFISMLGNVKVLIGSICSVVVATLFIVVASVIAMTIRERTKEIATLKALGLGRAVIFNLLVAEAVMISLFGGLLGIGVAMGLYGSLDMAKLTQNFFQRFELTSLNLTISVLVSILVGFLACLMPAATAARKTVVQGLKEIN